MLSLSTIRADTWKELKLQIPVHSAEMAKVYDELAAIDTSIVRTCIVGANSDVKSLNHALLNKELEINTLKELELLACRISGLGDWERSRLEAALVLEQPKSIGEMVSLSCNLRKFDLLPGVFTASGFVSRKDEPLEQIYRDEKLPEPYCDPDGIINVQLSSKGKPNAVKLTFPATDERIEAVLTELGVKDLDECYASCSNSVPGLLEHLPDYDGLECLNLAADILIQTLNSLIELNY